MFVKVEADIDTGTYHHDKELFRKLIKDLYDKYPKGVTLPPEYAEHFENNLLRVLIRLARYKFVARLVKKTDTVLEVGCGSGVGCVFLAQHAAHVTGIDCNRTEIQEARKINRRSNVSFHVQDLFQMPEAEKFDVVTALDVIEHMPKRVGHQLVSAMARHLKPTGMLVIGTPSVHSYKYQGALSRASHIKCYDQEELVELMDHYCDRTLAFSMNDELVHTGHPKMAWYYFILGFMPKNTASSNGRKASGKTSSSRSIAD